MAQGKGRGKFKQREKPEFDQQVIDLARVTRVTKGGKQMSFRACVLIGDRNGRVGYGVDKGKDVQIAVEKAVNQAKKNLIRIPLRKETLAHLAQAKYKAAKVMLMPAPKGSGIIAGSVIRSVFEMAGVPNASSKMLGKSNNKINNIKATFAALEQLQLRSGAKKSSAPKKKEVAKAETAEAPKKAEPKKRVAPKAAQK